jgi:hypothetical protein
VPLRNRVTPFARIEAVAARGLFMGQRGCLHDERRTLISETWKHKAWIVCLLEFRGNRRTVMAPRRYTELFFLDEAVALAAGHRPCAYCRRAAFDAFVLAWARVSGEPAGPGPRRRVASGARADPTRHAPARAAGNAARWRLRRRYGWTGVPQAREQLAHVVARRLHRRV